MLSPRSSAAELSRQRRAIARSRPSTPSSTGQVASSVSAVNTSWSTWRSFSSSPFERIGWPMISWWACSGVSVKRLDCGPTEVSRLITTRSRIESMAGLVTCANSCLKYE